MPLCLLYDRYTNRHSSYWMVIFKKISKKSVKLEPSEQRLFVYFDTSKFTERTYSANAIQQSEFEYEIWKYLQSEQQSTLQDFDRQITLRQMASEKTQELKENVLEAFTGVHACEVEFWVTNIQDEHNGEASMREIQCQSLLPITSVSVPDEVLDSKRSPIDKILLSEQALELSNFRICEGKLEQFCEQQRKHLSIDVLSLMVHKLRFPERIHFAGQQNENRTNANYCNPDVKIINSFLNSQTAQHMFRAQIIVKSNAANKDAIGTTNLLFGIQQLGQQNQETQIAIAYNDMSPPNSGPQGQPSPGHGPTGPYIPRNAAKQVTIFPPALSTGHEIPKIPKVMTKETIQDNMHG
ncbi:MAG: hypothetical protein EZS28_007203 [Streblomastix strix]|uniref:Uncharacterized protein n=1 Tax=Streblomastix strix TaxID=222440 RepID=A0A5J4WR65_9EUKA|nr:MAG: hypothetical protein EZS28_007203 [Streblomastix strix]